MADLRATWLTPPVLERESVRLDPGIRAGLRAPLERHGLRD